MPNRTPLGLPYVLPDDPLVNFPTTDVDNASRVDALFTIPSARVYNTVNQTIPVAGAGQGTVLVWNVPRWDTANLYNAANNSRLTAPKAGVYLIELHISATALAAGPNYARLRLNGNNYTAGQQTVPLAAGALTGLISFSTIQTMSPGHYAEAMMWQTTGQNMTLNSAATEFGMTYLGTAPTLLLRDRDEIGQHPEIEAEREAMIDRLLAAWKASEG